MQNTLRYIISIALIFLCLILNAQNCEKLIWQDEFEGGSLNLENWTYQIGNGCPDLCGWGNNEQQYYTSRDENIKVEDGKLIITAREDSIGGFDYSSARITSKDKVDFRYGRVEARIKLPETQGLWPAFWMLSTENKFGGWPKSGEIDIFELLGDKPTEILGTIHTGLPWLFISEKYTLPDSSSFADDFHVFSLEWSADTMKWFVDDIQYHEITSDSLSPWSPFQENFHLLLNVAVGGNLPGFTDSTTVLPQTMEVDYIRLYSKMEDLRITGRTPVMGEQGVSYKTFNIEDASYEWTVPDGSVLVSGQGSNEAMIDWGCAEGDLLLLLQTDCDSIQLSFPVATFLESNITGPQIISQKQVGLEYQVPAIADASYQWLVSNDVSITNGQGTNSITVDWDCEPGIVSVVIDGNCGQDTVAANVELIQYSISGLSFVSENAENRIYSIDSITNASYLWTVPPSASIASGQGSNEIVVNFGAEGGQVAVEVTDACGVSNYSFSVEISTSSLYCDFDGKDLEFGVFGGSVFEKIPNPFIEGINTSDHVGITRKDPGSVEWAGIFADLGQEIDAEETVFIHMKVYAPQDGIVKFKAEDQSTGVEPVEFDLEMPLTNEWVNMVWDVTGLPSETYDRIALFFAFGDVDTSYWYFDDILASTSTALSLEEVGSNLIEIYPNPSNGDISIYLEHWVSGVKPITLKLFNATGQLMHKEKQHFQSDRLNIRLPNMKSGNYFLVIEHENLVFTKSLVIID